MDSDQGATTSTTEGENTQPKTPEIPNSQDQPDSMTPRSKGSHRYLQQSPEDSETSGSTEDPLLPYGMDDNYNWTDSFSPPQVEVDIPDDFGFTKKIQSYPWNDSAAPQEDPNELGYSGQLIRKTLPTKHTNSPRIAPHNK
jgi:hypothetical protein